MPHDQRPGRIGFDRQTTSHPQPRRPRGRRPGVEGLEARQLLATLFVAAGGSDSNTGAYNSPFRDIQVAVNKAASGDLIKVAAGTYTYDQAADQYGPTPVFSYSNALGTVAVVNVVGKVLSIQGGFSTAAWGVQDPAANPTVIDGGGAVRGVLVVGDSDPTGLQLGGFTVQNGYAAPIPKRGGLDDFYAFGGGVFADMGGAQGQTNVFSFTNDVFRNDQAVAGAPPASGSQSEGGRAAGGAIAMRYVNNASMAGDSFQGNRAVGSNGADAGGGALGGAIHVDHSNVNAANLVFTNNLALSGSAPSGSGVGRVTGESADGLGGAVAVQVGSTFNLAGVYAIGNQARGGGASSAAGGKGGAAFGGAFYGEGPNAALTLTNAYMLNNSAVGGTAAVGGLAGGGGVETTGAGLNLAQSYVIGDAAQSGDSSTGGTPGAAGGGGLYLTRFSGSAGTTIVNTVIAGNYVGIGSGSGVAGGGGGGLWFQGVPANLVQDTIDGNGLDPRLVYGQALLLLNNGAPTPSTVTLTNSIISNASDANSAAVEVFGSNSLAFNRVLSFNNARLTDPSNGGVSGLNTVIASGPSASLPHLYENPGAPRWDYHLNTSVYDTNPAVANGLPGVSGADIDGLSRPAYPSLGAAEAVPPLVDFTGSVAVAAGGKAAITIKRVGDLSGYSTVVVSFAGGAARLGTDYQPLGTGPGGSATITFSPYDAYKTINLQTDANASFGFARIASVGLTATSGAQLGHGLIAVTILGTSGSSIRTDSIAAGLVVAADPTAVDPAAAASPTARQVGHGLTAWKNPRRLPTHSPQG